MKILSLFPALSRFFKHMSLNALPPDVEPEPPWSHERRSNPVWFTHNSVKIIISYTLRRVQRGLDLRSRRTIHVWQLTAGACTQHSPLPPWLSVLVPPSLKRSWEVCCESLPLSPEVLLHSFLCLCGPWQSKGADKHGINLPRES